MTTERKPSLIMLVLLGILVFVYSFGSAFYETRGTRHLPGSFEFLYRVAFLCGVVWWLQAEARTAVGRVYCPGLMVSIGWPIVVFYHLLKTRGVRGLNILLGLLSIFLVAHVLGAIAYVSFYD